MIVGAPARTWELDRTPDLVDLVTAARDAGHEVLLIERPMPDAVSIAAIGRALDLVATPDGVGLEDPDGRVIDREPGANRVRAAARLWKRTSAQLGGSTITATGPVAAGGFAYRP